jgi:hypothetical protein
MKAITNHTFVVSDKLIGAAAVGTAYLMYKGQVVYFTITYLGDRYMKFFM